MSRILRLSLLVFLITIMPILNITWLEAQEDKMGTLVFLIDEPHIVYSINLTVPVRYLKNTEMGKQLDLATFQFMRLLEVQVEGEKNGANMICCLKSKLTLSNRAIARMAFGYFKTGNEEQIFNSLGFKNITQIDTRQEDNVILQDGIACYKASQGEIKQTISFTLNVSTLTYTQIGQGEWMIKDGKNGKLDLNIVDGDRSFIGLVQNFNGADELFTDKIETRIEIPTQYLITSIYPKAELTQGETVLKVYYDLVPKKITISLEPKYVNVSKEQLPNQTLNSSNLSTTNISTKELKEDSTKEIFTKSTSMENDFAIIYSPFVFFSVIPLFAFVLIFLKPNRLKNILSKVNLTRIVKIIRKDQ